MVIPLLILFLLLASAAITVSQAIKPKISRAWLIAILSALAAWLAIFILRLYLPLSFASLKRKPVFPPQP
ncbi:MAG: hypothetical protein LC103_00815 [Anaerolineales bacterium]|nr:hypothetical protein [Anaerolineales bacterium]